jgi:CRP-like cAMP-binding protein
MAARGVFGGQVLSKPPLSALLSSFSPFEGMAAADVGDIVSRGRIAAFAKDKAVFEEGLEANAFFLLIEGFVRVVKTQPDGEQVVVRYFPAGELIGIAPAMNMSIYPASAIAAIDCVTLAWPSRLWNEFSRLHPEFVVNVLRAVGRRLQDSQTRLVQISTQRAEQRVALALLHIGATVGRSEGEGFKIDFPLSRQDLAEMTATTLHTVSRLLAEWERTGVVSIGRQKVAVLSKSALSRLAARPQGGSA